MKRDGWEIKKLGEVCTFQRGLTYTKSDEVDFSNNCVLRSNNIDLNTMTLAFDELKYVRDDLTINEERKVKAETILICMSNGSKQHIGKIAYINKDYGFAFGGFMGLIVPIKNVCAKYIYYSCLTSSYKSFLANIGNGANITNLKFSDLSKYKLPIPSLPEQSRIVEELDLLSNIIEKKRQQLSELDNLAQSIFYDMFGDPVTNEKGWEVKTFGGEFDISSGGTPDTKNSAYWDNGTISWIGSNLCQNVTIYNNDGKFITDLGLEKSSAKIYIPGYVLVALVGATIGKVALLKFETTTNQNVAGINVPKNDSFKSEFIFYLLQQLYCMFEAIGGDKFKMANLKFIRSLPLIIPPLSLQQFFAKKIEAIEKQKALIKQSIAETEELFNSRMDYYFS